MEFGTFRKTNWSFFFNFWAKSGVFRKKCVSKNVFYFETHPLALFEVSYGKTGPDDALKARTKPGGLKGLKSPHLARSKLTKNK